jgi:hypothetical protein
MGAEIKGVSPVMRDAAILTGMIVPSPPSNLLKNMTVVLLKMLTPISMSESYKNDV